MAKTKNILKICLIFAAFLTFAGTAWAGFNYNSVGNYFLIDSALKSGGDFILIGNAFNEELKNETGATTAFFAASNNIIFLGSNSKFCTIINDTDLSCTGSRQIQKIGGIYDFKTMGVTIKSEDKDFEIWPPEKTPQLTLTGKVAMNANFILRKDTNYSGLTLTPNTASANNIFASKILTNEIRVIGSDVWNIGVNMRLELIAGGEAEIKAEKNIIYTTGLTPASAVAKNFCYTQSWSFATMVANAMANKGSGDQATSTSLCTDNGGAPYFVDGYPIVCCAKKYYIFDMSFDPASKTGKIVCCRASNVIPQ